MTGCLKWVIILWTILIGIFFVSGMLAITTSMNPDMSGAELAGTGIGVTFGIGFYALAWGIIVIPAAVLFIILRLSATKAIKCPNCGSAIAEGSKFCSSCGRTP